MLIECDQCAMRDIACRDCVVTVLLGHGRPQPGLDADERRALRVLADARLIPPLWEGPAARAS